MIPEPFFPYWPDHDLPNPIHNHDEEDDMEGGGTMISETELRWNKSRKEAEKTFNAARHRTEQICAKSRRDLEKLVLGRGRN